MRSTRIVAATGALVVSLTTSLAAQGKSGGIAIIPFVGYGLPGTLAEDNAADIHFKPNGALVLGAQIELGLSKNLGIDVGVNRTFSQKLDETGSGLAANSSDDFSMTQVTGSIVIRPAGRRPNGSVAPLFIELGGGVTLYKIGSAAFSNADLNHTSPMGFVGAGYNVPMGPRATVQIFGRAQMVSSYSSPGLDAFNTAPPPSNVEGKMMLNLQFGAGLRYGR